MKKPHRALHELARRVLKTRLAARPRSAAAVADATQICCGELYRILETMMGTAGLQALIERALQLTARDYPWLTAVTPGPGGDCALTGLSEATGALDVNDAAEGAAALLATIVWLLISFIGEDLTSRLVRNAWPEVSFSRLSESATND
ncbi:MAG TPA: hypothetical protein VGF69_04130 [Thermoanaerobaculia bacterium]|jgi:hypothetical protein